MFYHCACCKSLPNKIAEAKVAVYVGCENIYMPLANYMHEDAPRNGQIPLLLLSRSTQRSSYTPLGCERSKFLWKFWIHISICAILSPSYRGSAISKRRDAATQDVRVGGKFWFVARTCRHFAGEVFANSEMSRDCGSTQPRLWMILCVFEYFYTRYTFAHSQLAIRWIGADWAAKEVGCHLVSECEMKVKEPPREDLGESQFIC